jgi:hypothetical protein
MADRVRIVKARNADKDIGLPDLLELLFYFIS